MIECFRLIHEEVGDSFRSDPDLVRFISDDRRIELGPPLAKSMVVVRVPDLGNKRTHLFVMTDEMEVLKHDVYDYLTADAEEALEKERQGRESAP